ncbi:MAG TPA: fructose-6-phosphate aldolase [Synergistales bacterium]|nr:fructose-6-phosphate aldolase [Synergistales bacterium]HRW88297.1 fructose-6-phosphate aldolase [Thermovirgaceae bacterium]
MRFFLDSADIDEIRRAAGWGVIDGVTTNPSLVAKSGGGDLHSLIREITGIVDGPVSAEVISLDAEGMVAEGRVLARIAPNVAVKIPMTKDGMTACSRLAREGVDVNVTLVFSPQQALLAASAGAAFVSPFVGRLDDIGEDGTGLVADIAEVFDIHGIETEIISASIRHPRHVIDSALAGADIATVPLNVLEKCFDHPLTESGIKKFLADWEGFGKDHG